MDINNAKERLDELKQIIEKANRSYYDLDSPTLEDDEYDAFMRELRGIEQQFPELLTADSPSQRVGGTAQSTFEKVQHEVQMGSLQDVFSFSEMQEFVERVKADGANEFTVEPKIDGLSVSDGTHRRQIGGKVLPRHQSFHFRNKSGLKHRIKAPGNVPMQSCAI